MPDESTLVGMSTRIDTSALTDDTRLVGYFTPILETAVRRQLWVFFLDEDDRPIGPAMPMDDYPDDPNRVLPTADAGLRKVAELFATRFARLMRECELAQILLVWERPGNRTLSGETLLWARALGAALSAENACVRAQLLLHSRGLRVLAPDDLV